MVRESIDSVKMSTSRKLTDASTKAQLEEAIHYGQVDIIRDLLVRGAFEDLVSLEYKKLLGKAVALRLCDIIKGLVWHDISSDGDVNL